MIDSVLIKIPTKKPVDTAYFSRKKTHETKGTARLITLSFEKAGNYKKAGIYIPQVSIEMHKRIAPARNICVQVSIPKLLYGNNLFEIDENSLLSFIQKLQGELRTFGLEVGTEEILSATICRIDFAKVIKLPSSTNPSDFIGSLEKAGYRPRADLTKRDIRNGKEGYWMKFYNSNSSLTIYDKMLEIQKQGYTANERALKELILKRKLHRNVIKFEVSLQRQQKVASVLNLLVSQKKSKYCLQDVFKKEISKKVLLHYLCASFNNDVDFLCNTFPDQSLRTKIFNLYSYQRNKTALYFLLEQIKERGTEIVFKEIQMLHGYSAKKRYERDLQELHLKLSKFKTSNILPVQFLKKALQDFTLYVYSSSNAST